MELKTMSRRKKFFEWLLIGLCILHIIIAPYTKVEESFNVQAIHDILYHQLNFSKYDHHEFPGVVARTFMGALAVSGPLFPVVSYFKWTNIAKHWVLYGLRLVLGISVILAFVRFTERIGKKFGALAGDFLRLTVATQFHFIFYCSRPLPNTFALLGVLWTYQKILDEHWLCAARIATGFTLLFRCELVLFYGCIFIFPVLTRQFPLFGWNGAVFHCLCTAVLTLSVSVPIDCFLWQRWVWPEGEVWWFNVILNRSHEYGIQPFFWYFYSAIPRAMMASTLLVPLGAVVDRRLLPFMMPVICYIFLYSFLPHKELRFIIYTFPLLNVSSAVFCARIVLMAAGIILHLVVNVIGTSIFLLVSSRNYPGGEALTSLQNLRYLNRNKSVSVYIDNYAAQTGVSRFLEWYGAWEYNKTENLELSQFARFDYLLIGSYSESDIANFTTRNLATHRILYDIKAFREIELKWVRSFPYFWPHIKFNPQLVVLEKIRPILDHHRDVEENAE